MFDCLHTSTFKTHTYSFLPRTIGVCILIVIVVHICNNDLSVTFSFVRQIVACVLYSCSFNSFPQLQFHICWKDLRPYVTHQNVNNVLLIWLFDHFWTFKSHASKRMWEWNWHHLRGHVVRLSISLHRQRSYVTAESISLLGLSTENAALVIDARRVYPLQN